MTVELAIYLRNDPVNRRYLCLQVSSPFANYMLKELNARCMLIEMFLYTRSTIEYTIFLKYYIAV